MGYPHLAACLWALCRLLSLLHTAEGATSALQCDTQSCSANSCCLGFSKARSRWQQGGDHWVCGCQPGTTRTIHNSSINCQEVCNISILTRIKELCRDEKSSPLCSQLLNTTENLKKNCANATQEGLEAMLNQLQNVVRKEQGSQRGAISTMLLIESAEAIVLQAGLSGFSKLETNTLQAETKMLGKECKTSRWDLELSVDREKLSIDCSAVPEDNGVVAFIVYTDFEGLFRNITKETHWDLNSRIVSGTVGKANIIFPTTFNITLQHTKIQQDSKKLSCVSWKLKNTEGYWTTEGCKRIGGDAWSSICACNHFSVFSILMAIEPNAQTDTEVLKVVTYVGLSVSLVCLFLAIITFILCRPLWSVSISLHLQLSICLFIADLLFLVNMSSSKLACSIKAGFLHYLFLSSFTWMFLEGLHLFLTVRNLRVLNYINASRFKRRYIYPVGYGLPAIVVATSAAVYPNGYGTDKDCWLSTEQGFRWSFLGPVCVIILINLMFFLITLWTLRKRLSSLNADITAIKNTRLMTFKALAHFCILGCTWGVGLFQKKDDQVITFLFTIINSLQGAVIFLVHCVLNRQVIEYYQLWFRMLGWSPKPQEMPTTEMRVTYVTEGDRSQSHSAEGCAWEK